MEDVSQARHAPLLRLYGLPAPEGQQTSSSAQRSVEHGVLVRDDGDQHFGCERDGWVARVPGRVRGVLQGEVIDRLYWGCIKEIMEGKQQGRRKNKKQEKPEYVNLNPFKELEKHFKLYQHHETDFTILY